MIRYAALTAIVLFLSAYAWKDWYKSLCGLIVLMAVVSYSGMPRAMLGIPGISPFNLVFANVLLASFRSLRKEQLRWDVPSGINFLLLLYFIVVLVALIRYHFSQNNAEGFYDLVIISAPSTREHFIDYLVNGVKWVLPGLLLYVGCNSKQRLQYGVVAIMTMYLILAILVIRWMPLGLLTDADALQRRAVRVLGRELGYFRTNLSVMLAGAFWMFVTARTYFDTKYSLLINGSALIILLAMFLTGGRGGYLAWFSIGVLVSFVKWRRYLILGPILLMIILTLIPSVQDRILGEPEDIHSVVLTSDDDVARGQASAGRTQTWPRVVDKIIEAPLFGYGFQGIITSGVSEGLKLDYNYTFLHPHNSYLQTLIDNGILGSLPILLFFYLAAKYSWSLFRDKRDSDYAFAGGVAVAIIFTFLIAGLTGQSFYPEERSVGLWCAMALMARVAVQRYKRDQQLAPVTND